MANDLPILPQRQMQIAHRWNRLRKMNLKLNQDAEWGTMRCGTMGSIYLMHSRTHGHMSTLGHHIESKDSYTFVEHYVSFFSFASLAS